MPTQKIDPKVIFASDAPAIDKPPVFSDKTKGWDVARANDGRPEIKQMNKIQQDTDLKILWLNENAVLPYDASIDYPEGAVTLKDGSFKQLSSGAWVEFLDDFADKDAVKRGIANRYDSSLSYNSGERVVLANGDIVKSTIDGNANDPNVDMTGWLNQSKRASWFVTPEMFGAVGNGLIDDTDALIAADTFAKANNCTLTGSGTYLISRQWQLRSRFVALYSATIKIANNFPDDTAVLAYLPFGTHNGELRMRFDGNKDNQTHYISALKYTGLGAKGYQAYISGHNCHTLLHIAGAIEKADFWVHGSDCDRIVHDSVGIPSGSATDVTPDENRYCITASGVNTKQAYYKDSESISVVDIMSEGGSAERPVQGQGFVHYATTGGKKNILRGVIRTPNNTAISVNGNSAVHFGDVVVYSPSAGYGLHINSDLQCTGAVTVEQQRGGNSVFFEKLSKASDLQINVSGWRGGSAVVLGTVTRRVEYSDLTLNLAIANTDDHLLDAVHTQGCNIKVNFFGAKPATKGINLNTEHRGTSFKFNYRILEGDIPVLSTSTYAADIEFVSSAGEGTRNAYSTPVKGMRVVDRLTGIQNMYDGSKWVSMELSRPTTSLVYDPPSLAAAGTVGDSVTTAVTLAGAVVGNPVLVGFSRYNEAIEISAQVSSANTVTVKFKNSSSTPIDLVSGTLVVKLI